MDLAVGGKTDADRTWMALVSDMKGPVSTVDRSAIVGSRPKVMYGMLKEKLCQFQASSDSPQRYPQSKDVITDDDASVYPVSGYALHSCLKFRQRALARQKSQYTTELRVKCKKELWLLKKLEGTNKSFIPSLLKFQNQGHMVIRHHAMLPFGRSLLSSMQLHVNYRRYQEHGSNIFTKAHTQVLNVKLAFHFQIGHSANFSQQHRCRYVS